MEVDDSIAVPDAADIVDEDIVDDAPDAISKELEFNVDENPNEKTAAAASVEGLRPSTLHLIGVDDLSTDDIREYVTALVNDNFKIEWVRESCRRRDSDSRWTTVLVCDGICLSFYS